MDWLVAYRRVSLLLVKAFVYIFDKEEDEEELFDRMLGNIQDNSHTYHIKKLRTDGRGENPAYRMQVIEDCMSTLDDLVRLENKKIEALLISSKITDTESGQLSHVLKRWEESTGVWTLINDFTKSENPYGEGSKCAL